MSKHPTRQELIKAIKSRNDRIDAHLKKCQECSLLFGVLKKTQLENSPFLASAPEGWVMNAVRIAKPQTVGKTVRKLIASLTFDSWVARPVAALRSTGASTRRLSYEASGARIDFQCSGRKGDWQFTANLRGTGIEPHQFKLRAGRKVILPDESQLFTWTAKSLPKSMEFASDTLLITVDQLDWHTQTNSN